MAPALLVRRLALAGLLLAPAGTPAPQGVAHLRSVLPLEGMVLDWAAADADGDGRKDLFAARRLPGGQRVIHVFLTRAEGVLPTVPDLVVDVKKDVVSWGVGEFRPGDPGAELLLTTRAGVFTLSPRKRGYRENVRRVVATDLLLDLASDRALPRWQAVADVDADGVDEIALATTRGFMVVRPGGEVLGEIRFAPQTSRRPAAQRAFKIGTTSLSSQPLAGLFVPDEDPGALDPPPILFAHEELPLPFLEDTDGDGLKDLVYYGYGFLFVHRLKPAEGGGEAAGRLRYPQVPDLRVPLHKKGDWDLEGLELVHHGGGPAADLLVVRKDEGGLLSSDFQILLFHDALSAPGLLKQPPAGVVQVDASWVRPFLVNLDGDEVPDLAVDAWSLTLSTLGIQGVDIEHQVKTWLSNADETIDARAGFPTYERDYSADDFTAFSLVPALGADLDGDGLTDLLEPDSHGVLEMHPFVGPAGFADQPAWTIPVEALTSTVAITDLNADGVGDFLVLHDRTLRKPVSTFEVFISRRRP